jgi:dGTPase
MSLAIFSETELRQERRRPEAPLTSGSLAVSPFAIDCERLRSCHALRRLRGITQVMAPSAPGQFHNRWTHTLAVARIGRTLATSLLGEEVISQADGGALLDPDVVEAACLAHDLGHPPFGHDAEDELNRLLTDARVADGFEANAQTFRIVTRLATDDGSGLNLTRATLDAILKYPWQRADAPPLSDKWGVYASEAEILHWVRTDEEPSRTPALEAALMDLADFIAYAVDDFADFACAGLIPLAAVGNDSVERDRFLGLVAERRAISPAEHADLERALDSVLARYPAAGRAAMKAACGEEIAGFIAAVTLDREESWTGALRIDRQRELEIFVLEGLTWHYVIDSALLLPQRRQQRQVIRTLFADLSAAAIDQRDRTPFPAAFQKPLRDAESDAARLRIVADTIASMTEEEAMRAAGRPE